ncbi:hypothetical protein KUTeg_022539, partial [Tegillarca granosa]
MSIKIHQGMFTWPHGVSENINKDICVVDRTSKTSGRLVVVDNKGKLRYTYDGQKLNHSFYPRDVKCDKSGHVIVNDRNNIKVHILDLNGQFIRYIADENILKDNPICLALDKNGILWVGGSIGNVYRLRYLNKSGGGGSSSSSGCGGGGRSSSGGGDGRSCSGGGGGSSSS